MTASSWACAPNSVFVRTSSLVLDLVGIDAKLFEHVPRVLFRLVRHVVLVEDPFVRPDLTVTVHVVLVVASSSSSSGLVVPNDVRDFVSVSRLEFVKQLLGRL